ncbi:MAG: LURP-one-related family protein [Rubripirellula sp.]|nr:LURP-one-related family protein [Rubripirellula sp.]
MVFRIKEKFWSWGNDFAITDADGNEVYYVDGIAFSWGNKLSFQNPGRQELALISQKLLSWKPLYQIIIDGQIFAEVVKEWTWFNKKFTLDVPGPNDYTIDGSFWSHEFSFQRQGRAVATVSKKYWSWTDSYGVEIVDGEDEVAILCACIVIDQVLHDESKSSSINSG